MNDQRSITGPDHLPLSTAAFREAPHVIMRVFDLAKI